MEEHKLDTVLVVGGSGFLGSHIVKRLLAGSHTNNVVITSRNPKSVEDGRISYQAVDISAKVEVDALFDRVKPHVVIHTVSAPPRTRTSELIATNILGTQYLLEAAKACPNTKAFVYTSSDSACYPSPFKQITEDECKLYNDRVFKDVYGKTKAIGDATVLAANSIQLKTAVIRLPLIYGEEDTHFVSQAVASIRKGEHKNQLGPNIKMWEYVYVGSAAEAHILAAKALASNVPEAEGQAFFITDGVPMPFFDFMRMCYAAAGHPVPMDEVKVIPFWIVMVIASLGEWLYWVFTFGRVSPKLTRDDINHLDDGCWWNIEKAKRVLHYTPVLEQDEAVRRSMEWGVKHY